MQSSSLFYIIHLHKISNVKLRTYPCIVWRHLHTFDDDDTVRLGLSERVCGHAAVLPGVLGLTAADLHRDHAVGVGDVVLAAGQLLVALVPFHLQRRSASRAVSRAVRSVSQVSQPGRLSGATFSRRTGPKLHLHTWKVLCVCPPLRSILKLNEVPRSQELQFVRRLLLVQCR